MKHLASYTAIVLGTLMVILLLWEFRGAILLFLLSLVVAAAVRPIHNYVRQYGLSSTLALVLIYAIGLTILGVSFYTISGLLLNDLEQISNDFALTYEQIKLEWPKGNGFQQTVAEQLPPPLDFYKALAGEEGVALFGTLFDMSSVLFTILGQILIILVLSIYWSADRARFERLWLSLLPAEQRVRAREVWREMEEEIGAYLRSELVQGFLAGLFLGFGYWLLGLPYTTMLALFGALVWLVPLVGGVLAVIPVFLVGLSSNLVVAVAAAAYTMIVFLALELVIERQLFDRQRYSSLLLILGMIMLATDFGLLGLIVAPPLMVAIQIFFNALLVQKSVAGAAAAARPQQRLVDLKERLAVVKEKLAELERAEAPSPETASLLERLAKLMNEADETLPPPLEAEPVPTS
jgi:predicted PurR-regulated permease PerM